MDKPGAVHVVVPRKEVGRTFGIAVTPGRVKDTIGGTATTAA